MRIFKNLFFLAFLTISTASVAQTYTVVTADQAVQALLGPGVQYSNAEFTGQPEQLALLAGGVAPLALTTGVVLNTSNVDVLTQVNVPANPSSEGSGATPNEDLLEIANSVPDLLNLNFSVGSINDLAILEFDFVATGSTLSFDYIFGSIEYPEWENSQYNDVFAFFLSGPGIVGPYASPPGFPDGSVNLATVPNSNPALPITISSVNSELNSQYFIGNLSPDQQGICLDGVTTLLTVTSELICGATYHIALAIADGSDGGLHSTVILKSGSFSIAGDLITPITDDAAGLFPELTIVEGCIPGEFVINNIPCLTEPLTVDLEYSGTAFQGDDYQTSFPTTLTFEPGVDEYLVEILPLDDDFEEGPESITISFTYIDYNGEEQLETATVFMQDYDVNEPFISDIPSSFICPDETAVITPVPNQGYPPYSFTWSNGATGPVQEFGYGSEGMYEVTLTDLCDYTWTETFQIFEPDTFKFNRTTICLGEIGSPVQGGQPPYTYVFDPNVLIEETNTVLRAPVFGTVNVTVTDGCGQVRSGVIEVQSCKIPDVFTPNGDGRNDFFVIEGIDAYPNSNLKVWNRWGVIVYESENYENFWSAEEQPDGVYYFVLQRSDGKVFEGQISILRDE